MTLLNRLVLALVFYAVPMQAISAQDDEHFHHNHLGVMVGGMTPLSATSATSFAVGVDYERRFTRSVGAGLVVDFTFGDHARSALIATGVTYRPLSALRLSAGPGIELVETAATGGGTKTKAYFLIGAGAAYEFHVGAVTLAPTVFIDFVGETKTNLTYGLAIGYGF